MLKKYLMIGSFALLGFNLGVEVMSPSLMSPSLEQDMVKIENQSHVFNPQQDDENYNHVLGRIDQGIYTPLNRGLQ